MKKPVYLGQVILDLSKIVMYEFHYDYMTPKFKDPQLCYMDTDSLIYNIKTEDFYTDISTLTTNYWEEQKGYSTHERRIRRQDNDRIYSSETKAIFL